MMYTDRIKTEPKLLQRIAGWCLGANKTTLVLLVIIANLTKSKEFGKISVTKSDDGDFKVSYEEKGA